jgi:alanyl-tRNA synthetase
MNSRTIRDRFFTFFAERDHQLVPSASLIPNDPTLLLVNAGMVQFKPFFQGEQTPPYKRAMSVQKCARTPDIDEVGKTARHLTFFEMLGNFAFGDYYKLEAARWAWELVTEGWGIDADRLWPTIYEQDEESFGVWADGVGVRPDRIVRRGPKDNFWSMGVAGPCGPCSEIYVDLGEKHGPASDLGPEGNEDRYLEIWNLVFMQNECNHAIEPIADLPKKNIDTGAGVERLAMVLQGADTIYDTDMLGGLTRRAGELTGSPYGSDPKVDMTLRILGDHGRFMTFLIADGVLPSNEARGYVLRRVMRRAVRHARLMGHEKPILPDMAEATIELMSDVYPEIAERRDFICDIAEREEARFGETLKQGLTLLEREMSKMDEGKDLPGEVAFQLHDTFGFPIDLTTEIASEAGLSVDQERFSKLMTQQRERARAARRALEEAPSGEAFKELIEHRGPTDFVGYEFLSGEAEIIAISSGETVASEGDEIDVVLDRTCFYPEGGGQVGDHGELIGPSGRARVTDTRRLLPGLIGHRVHVTTGEMAVGDAVKLVVDADWRSGSQRAHTATHILHWILRDRLGEHAKQAGSLVEPGRLRFDFNHFEALGDQVQEFSQELQARVLLDDSVRAYETSYDYARSIGAMAIFGEKYGDFVRVVEVGEYSKELCGGTHVPHTSQIGVAVITAEGSIGANLRRVEALVGTEGLRHLEHRVAVLERTAEILKVNPDEVADRVEKLMVTHKELERKVSESDRKAAASDASALAEASIEVDGTRLVVARRDIGVEGLRSLAQNLKGRLQSAVIVLGTAGEGRANLVGALTKDLLDRGLSARDLLAPGAALLGGGAGGKPDLAISGGPSEEKLDDALQAVERAVRDALQP